MPTGTNGTRIGTGHLYFQLERTGVQKKFCSKPYTPERVLALALSHERGLADQQSLSSCAMGLAIPTLGGGRKTPKEVHKMQFVRYSQIVRPRGRDNIHPETKANPVAIVVGPLNRVTKTGVPPRQ